MPIASGKPELSSADDLSLHELIDARLRLDELGTAKLIADAAELVHKAQAGGQPLACLSPATIRVQPTGQ
nr:hypothetical protein [Deltaproteobacteria bacterium]